MTTSEATNRHPCVFRAEGATQEECEQLTADHAHNVGGCCPNTRTPAGCLSPYRKCVMCVLDQKLSPKKVIPVHLVIDYKLGLCSAHLDQIRAKPTTDGKDVAVKRGKRSAAVRDPSPATMAMFSAIENKPAQWQALVDRYFSARRNGTPLPLFLDTAKVVIAIIDTNKLTRAAIGELFGYAGQSASNWVTTIAKLKTFSEEEQDLIAAKMPDIGQASAYSLTFVVKSGQTKEERLAAITQGLEDRLVQRRGQQRRG